MLFYKRIQKLEALEIRLSIHQNLNPDCFERLKILTFIFLHSSITFPLLSIQMTSGCGRPEIQNVTNYLS
ncbi:unnamed protein product [Caenorhabditis nigoni]